MIKVIGQSKEHAKYTVCKNCGAEIEYHQNDVKEYHGKDYSGGPDGKEYIECPQCTKEVILKRW
jgi:hypothetical protein